MDEDETAFRFNIQHFRSLLATERNEATLKVVQQLLADEEEKLCASQIDKQIEGGTATPIHRFLKASKLGPKDVERLNRAYRYALRNLLIATILAQISSIKRLWAQLVCAISNKAIVVLAVAIAVATLCGVAIARLPILGLLEASCDSCN